MSALEHVRFKQVSLYFKSGINDLEFFKKGPLTPFRTYLILYLPLAEGWLYHLFKAT